MVDGTLRARVGAPASDGAANASLIRLIAEELGVAKGDVRIVAGAASRQKLIVVDRVDAATVLDRWPGLKL